MTIRIKDLIKLGDAASSLERSVNDLLLDSIEGDLQLFSIAKRDRSLGLIPCTTKFIEEEGFYIYRYTQDDIV